MREENMEVVLQHVSMIPGVMGCFMCNGTGHPLARSFPATCDAEVLKRVSAILPEIAETLHGQTDGAKLVDLNYDFGRVIVKQLPEGFLALVCTQTINLQILSIQLNIAQNKISNLMLNRQPQPVPPPLLSDTLRKEGNGVLLAIDSMTVSAKIKWNQMEESVAISSKLSLELQRLLNIGPFKKIKLTNKIAGSSKAFGFITFERDNSQLFDDKVVLTLAAAEAMKAKPGDEITAEPVSGGGFFSWK